MAKDKFVTGVGSRDVDDVGKARVIEIAKLLHEAGYILRSGGADGCDTLFEKNMPNKKNEIYLPWKGFNDNKSPLFDISKEAVKMAATVHPKYYSLSLGPQKLHARNTYQVLGKKLDHPSDLLVCWTPDGCRSEKSSSIETGGTRTAIVLADRNNVPIYNLYHRKDFETVKDLLEKEIGKVKGTDMAKKKEAVQENADFMDIVDSLEKEQTEEKATKKATKKTTKKATKEATKEEKKPKGQTLVVEDRGEIKTLMFKPGSYTWAKDGENNGYNLESTRSNGDKIKIFIPKDDGKVKTRVIRKEGQYKGYLVVETPLDAKFKFFQMVEDKSAPNWERYEEKGAVYVTRLEKIRNAQLAKDKEQAKEASTEKVEATEQVAETKVADTKVADEKEATEVKATEETKDASQEKAENNGPKPIWIDPANAVTLRFGKGYFIKGFSHGDYDNLVIHIPMKGEGVSARRLKNWIMVTADKGTKFHLYRPTKDGKSFEDTGLFIRDDLFRKKVWEQNNAKKAERAYGNNGTSDGISK